jgi:hypothetical protein
MASPNRNYEHEERCIRTLNFAFIWLKNLKFLQYRKSTFFKFQIFIVLTYFRPLDSLAKSGRTMPPSQLRLCFGPSNTKLP